MSVCINVRFIPLKEILGISALICIISIISNIKVGTYPGSIKPLIDEQVVY